MVGVCTGLGKASPAGCLGSPLGSTYCYSALQWIHGPIQLPLIPAASLQSGPEARHL